MTRILRNCVALAVAFGVLACAFPASAAIPPPPAAPAIVVPGLASDPAATRLLALQQSIAGLEEERVAIDSRLVLTSRYILDQSAALDRANEALASAQEAFNQRAIAIYKFDDYDLLAMLLDSSSVNDLVSRLSILRRILDTDRYTLEEMDLVATEARAQAGRLEQVRQQDVDLRTVREDRIRITQGELAEQQGLIDQLTPEGRAAIEAQARAYRSSRAQWKAASIPVGTAIRKVSGCILGAPSRVCLVSQFHYREYQGGGKAFKAVCSSQAADLEGRVTASGQSFNAADFTCAHMTLPLGTWLALTRYDPKSRTTTRIVVVVNDRGPFVPGRDIDLSPAAAVALGVPATGAVRLDAEVVTPVR